MGPSVDPADSVAALLSGHWRVLAVRAACELGLFDAVEGSPAVSDLAIRTGCGVEELRRLLRVLADVGLVAVGADDAVGLTEAGRLLTASAPGDLAALTMFRTASANLLAWNRLADAVRTGRGTFEPVNGRDLWSWLESDPDEQRVFDTAMARRSPEQATAVLAAVDLGQARSLVDVGGGRGGLLAALLSRLPLARGVVAERPDVASAATAHLDSVGLHDRAHGVAADFRQAVPGDGDVYLLSNVLHDWPDEDALAILAALRSSMPAGATLLVVEQLLGAEPTPADEATLHLVDLHMLVVFGARERSGPDYQALLARAGFPGAVVHGDTGTSWQVVEARS